LYDNSIRHTIRRAVITTLVVIISIGVIIVIMRWVWLNWPEWSGFGDKTLWDLLDLLIVPTVLAIGALLFNLAERSSATKIANDRIREATLQKYIETIAELLLENKLISSKKEAKAARDVARAQTLTVLRGLDGVRKGIVLRFLYESELIKRIGDKPPVINLHTADLRSVVLKNTDLSFIDLSGSDMREAEMNSVILQYASLSVTNFCNANLNEADFSNANLRGADLSNASMRKVNLSGSIRDGVNLEGAILTAYEKLPERIPACAARVLARQAWFIDPGVVNRVKLLESGEPGNRLASILMSERFSGGGISLLSIGRTMYFRFADYFEPHTIEGLSILAGHIKLVEMYERYGLLKFYFNYLKDYILHGYGSPPLMDQEAYKFSEEVRKHLTKEFAHNKRQGICKEEGIPHTPNEKFELLDPEIFL